MRGVDALDMGSFRATGTTPPTSLAANSSGRDGKREGLGAQHQPLRHKRFWRGPPTARGRRRGSNANLGGQRRGFNMRLVKRGAAEGVVIVKIPAV